MSSKKLLSTNMDVLEAYTVDEIKEELRSRKLPVSGIKQDILMRLLSDNERIHGEQVIDDAHIKSESNNEEPNNTKQLSSLNDNSNLYSLLQQITTTQQQLAEILINSNKSNNVQIFSTNDTATAIPLFDGNKSEDVNEWIKEVERIARLANWSETLKLVNSSIRLRGSALNWHKVNGKAIDSWDEWKNKLIGRFKTRMSSAEYILYQSKRILKPNETIVEYIYDKNALLEKSPFKLEQKDRISLILEGITDRQWSVPLATHQCETVDDFINHAMPLDLIRKVQQYTYSNSKYDGNVNADQEQNKNVGYIKKYNPDRDRVEDQVCYVCKDKGHVSYTCPQRAENSKQENNMGSKKTREWGKKNNYMYAKEDKSKQVSCVSQEAAVTLIPIVLNNGEEIHALPDSGSVITLIQRKLIPKDSVIYPWQKGSYKVVGTQNEVMPLGWFTSNIKVGSIEYVLPQIGICEYLPVPMILGKDWQFAVHARIIHEPDGSICIMTPFATESFGCKGNNISQLGCCVAQSRREYSLAIKDNFNINDDKPHEIEEITEEEMKVNVDELLVEYEDIFTSTDNEIGEVPGIQLEINLVNNKPIKCKPYRLTEPERQFLKTTVEKWMKLGVCRMSMSPYAAPMFVIEQPFHDTTPFRPVVDYSRTINPITIPDPQPIDNMDDIIKFIATQKWKFTLDVHHAYHNIKIKEEDIYKTAAVTPDYHVEFLRVMFGLAGGPAIMSRVIKATYGQLFNEGVRTYFDDVSGGAKTLKQLFELLRKTFAATRKMKLKLNYEKCNYFTKEVKLFGRILGPKGQRPDPQRLAAVDRYITLNSVHEVRSFLGFCNTFRKHIQNYSNIAKPLSELLKKQKQEKVKIVLNEKQQLSFEKLKQLIISPPTLAYFKLGAETIVETDASHEGLGACLLQVHDGEKCVIEYASRTLKDPETRYHINELEVTAVHWALVEKFRLYLVGQPFTIITDNFTTAYVVNKAKLNRKFARYVVDLAVFEFKIVHRPGKQNLIADHLSRYPQPSLICLPLIESTRSRLRLAQEKDSYVKMITQKLESTMKTQHIDQIREKFKIEDDILVHVSAEHGNVVKQIVVPYVLRSTVLKLCHDECGHLSFEVTLRRVRAKYWWKSIRKDVKKYTKACLVCAKVNRRTVLAYGQMGHRPIPTLPWEVVSADHIVALPKTKNGNVYILLHIDHATRYLIAKPTCSLAADDVVDTIEHDIIYRFGPPTTYISDMGTCFTSKKAKQLFDKYGIQHLPTTPYTPQSNGLVERANATLIATLTKMAMEEPLDWDCLLPRVVLAINTAQQKTTKLSPFYLLHGYQPKIPPNEIHVGTLSEDVNRLEQLELLAKARQVAIQNIIDVHQNNKNRFDLRRIEHSFKEGDLVLYNWPQAGDDKLTPKFKGPYRIERPVGEVCYKITDVNSPKIVKTVHVQLLRALSKPHQMDVPEDINFNNNDQRPLDDEEEDEQEQENHEEVYTTSRRGRTIRLPRKFDEFVCE